MSAVDVAIPDEVASNWLSEPALTAELVFEEYWKMDKTTVIITTP